MNIEQLQQEQQVKETRSLKYVQVKDDLYVFSYTRLVEEKKMPLFFGEPRMKNVQGFILKSNLDAFISGAAKSLNTEKHYAVVTPEFLAFRAKYGSGMTIHDKEEQAVYAGLSDNYFDEFVRVNGNLDLVIQNKTDSGMLFALDGSVLPVAIFFDYISGYTDNENYDLQKAVEILQKNPQVEFIKMDRLRTGVIEEIPYYNASKHRNRCIAFIFRPTKEQVNQMWELQKKLHKKYPSTVKHHAVFELDLLGLRKGGAAKFNSFLGKYASEAGDKE